MSIIEDVLDFLFFLFLLGMCLAVSFSAVLPTVYETETSDITARMGEDKAIQVAKGYKQESSYDGTMSALEVVLMTQVQDFGLPEPKRYNIKGMDVPVDSVYRANVKQYGNTGYSRLKIDDPTATGRYTIEYSYGLTDNPNDDYYYVQLK